MRRILVVGDEEKIRAIIRKYGEFEGYDITGGKRRHGGGKALQRAGF